MKKLLLIAAVAISFTACTKDDNGDTGTNPGGTVTDTLLSRFIEFDTLHVATMDTTEKASFSYDNNKRLSVFSFSDYDTADGSLLQQTDIHYTYSGSNIYPSSSVSYSTDYDHGTADPTTTTNSTYSFNGSNLAYEKDIYGGGGDSQVNHYTFTDSLFSYFDTYTSGHHDGSDSVFYHQTLTGNNITSAFADYNNQGTIALFNFISVSYDTHKSPWRNVALAFVGNGGPSQDQGYFGGTYLSYNNVIAYTFNYADPVDYGVTTLTSSHFVYNSADFPVSYSFRFDDTENSGQHFAGKRLFFYTH